MEAPPNESPTRASGFWRVWDLVPAKFFIVMLALCAYFGDRAYPFSNFPMYSTLGKKAAYVYVTDATDQPIALAKEFAQRTSNLSKALNTNLKKVTKSHGRKRKEATPEDFIEAGRICLARLESEGRARRPEVPRRDELRLWYVEISRDKREIKEKKIFAGSVRADEVKALAPSSRDEAEDEDVD